MADPDPTQPTIIDGLIQATDEVAALADQARAMTGTATNLVNSAGTGFTLTPEAAATLIKAVRESMDEVQGALDKTMQLQDPPKLGDLDGARKISQFTWSVANDDQGMRRALQTLLDTLTQMLTAYQKASTNYEETEQLVAEMMNQKTSELPDGGFVQ